MFRDSIMTKWNDFVKKWAEEHGLTYGCSLSTPECKLDYQMSKGTRLPARTSRLPKPTGKAPSMRGNRPAPPPKVAPPPQYDSDSSSGEEQIIARSTSRAKKSYQGSSAPRSNSYKLSAPMTQSKAILMEDIYLPTPPPTPPPVGDLLQQHYDRIEREHLREYGPKHRWGKDERLSYSNERHKYEWLKERQLGAFSPPTPPSPHMTLNIQHHTIPQPPSREPIEDPEDAQGWSSGEEEVIEEGWWEADGLHLIKHAEVLEPQVAFSEEEPPLYLEASAITKVSPKPQYTIAQDIPKVLKSKAQDFQETLAYLREEKARAGPIDSWGSFAPRGRIKGQVSIPYYRDVWSSDDEEEQERERTHNQEWSAFMREWRKHTGQLKPNGAEIGGLKSLFEKWKRDPQSVFITKLPEPPSRNVAKPTEDHLKSTVSAKVAPQVAQTNHIYGYVKDVVNPHYIDKYGPTQAWDARRWKFYNEEVDMAIKKLGGEEKHRLKKTRGPYNKDPDKAPPPEPAFRRGPYRKKAPFFVSIA